MSFKKIVLVIIVVAIAVGGYVGFDVYKKIFSPNIKVVKDYVNIPTGSTFDDVKRILTEQQIVLDTASFNWVAKQMKYTTNIHPGHYKLQPGMSNKELVSLLRSGRQTPVKVTFNNIRTNAALAGQVAESIEADSISLLQILNNDSALKKYGFTSQTVIGMFIPNTYEFYWNTSANKFIERMAREYKDFWNAPRKLKAKTIGLTQTQVSAIAAIVEQETQKKDERPLVAGVYMNRYLKGWKLEADPTLVFALGDFSVQRVLNEYKEIDSPYNTYMYAGLPPGPICMPSISSIDAVLNYTKHEYFYFCAKDDFSGYHSFAKTYSEHLLNAKRFQMELNRRHIRS